MSYYDKEDLLISCDEILRAISKIEQDAFLIDSLEDSTIADKLESIKRSVSKIKTRWSEK